MAKAEMGYLGSYNKNKPSPFEGFDVGGDGMSGYNVYVWILSDCADTRMAP